MINAETTVGKVLLIGVIRAQAARSHRITRKRYGSTVDYPQD